MEKHKLLAKFFTKCRSEGDPDLDKLFELDDHWSYVYEQHRIKLGFTEAKILANESVINKVLS